MLKMMIKGIVIGCFVILSAAGHLLVLNRNVLAEEFNWYPEWSLTITPPLGWEKRVIPPGMESTKIIWRRPDDEGFLLIKTEKGISEGRYTDSESYASFLRYYWFKQGTRGTQGPIPVSINNVNWMKLSTETEEPRGVILISDTYCFFANGVGIQIRLMGDKEYWKEITKETEESFKSIRLNLKSQ